MAAPPHPRANPVLGSALDLRQSQIRTYERAMREHGDVVRLVVGPPEAIIAVALLLQRFQIRSGREDVPLDTEGITLRPRGAVPIQPAAR
jgi:hypothetical protein